MSTSMRLRQSSATTTPEKAAMNNLHHAPSQQPHDEILMQRLLSIDDADMAAGDVAAYSTTTTSSIGDDHLKVPLFSSSSSQGATASLLSAPAPAMATKQRTHTHHYTPPPVSMNTQVTGATSSDLDFFDDLVSEPVLVLGFDISHMSRNLQFLVCASGVFVFSLMYGYLQELISVQLCNRKLGLFLATVQFVGYTVLAYLLRTLVYERHVKQKQLTAKQVPAAALHVPQGNGPSQSNNNNNNNAAIHVPFVLYLGLSLLRALDLGMTNLAMQYLNYPAKTLLKSSRVVFTMLFGVVLLKKQYSVKDYAIVGTMVFGLALFLHADAHSSAVFAPMGVIMLTVSLVCDGAITNVSETILQRFGVGQDEFIFKMYSIALIAIAVAAAAKGDLRQGLDWLMQPGTYDELLAAVPVSERTWTVPAKIGVLTLFSSMGFFGSSCSAAITKQFGALTMSITSVTRKATTLFLSFFLFHNVCTLEHLAGVFIFISALTAKSLRRRNDKKSRNVVKWNSKSSRHNSPFASGNSLSSMMHMLNGGGGDSHMSTEGLKQLELREQTTGLLSRARSDDSMKSTTNGMTKSFATSSPYIV